jgi:hypothetical protein
MEAPVIGASRRGLPLAIWAAGAVVVLAFLGFYPTYFGLFPAFAGTSASIHFHVATLLLWLALAVVQPALVRRRNIALHRRLGKLSYGLLPLLCLGFVLAMNDGQRRHPNPDLILATMFDAGLFVFFAAMGIGYRHRPALHAGYMKLTLVPFLDPTLGRLLSPVVGVTVALLVILALLVRALAKKQEARPYIVGAAFFVAALSALFAVMTVRPDLARSLWQAMYGA